MTLVVVTGGGGFIGSHLSEVLGGLGASVVILDDLSAGSRENVEAASPADFVQGSIVDVDAVKRATAGCRFVFHQAALGSVPRSLEHPRLYGEVNAQGTVNVLEAARHAGVGRVMFAASSSAYGENAVPWVETMTPRPRTTGSSGARISLILSGSLDWISIMPTSSPSISKVCASAIGMMTNALS